MKDVFVASAQEGHPIALSICELLRSIDNVKPIPWTSAFSLSTLTLEAIEKTMAQVCGAVFVATPDVQVLHRGQHFLYPAPNVLFELGLFSARLGRPNVILCTFDMVSLPTDLNAFTHVNMGREFDPNTFSLIDTVAIEEIANWASALPSRLARLPLTAVVHGYSGRWRCKVKFTKWRDYVLKEGESVRFEEGYLDLSIISSDARGQTDVAWVGSVHGKLEVALAQYSCTIHVNDTVENVKVDIEGNLQFESKQQSREISDVQGKDPNIEGAKPKLPGPKKYTWDLSPDKERHELIGHYFIEGDHRDRANVTLTKL